MRVRVGVSVCVWCVGVCVGDGCVVVCVRAGEGQVEMVGDYLMLHCIESHQGYSTVCYLAFRWSRVCSQTTQLIPPSDVDSALLDIVVCTYPSPALLLIIEKTITCCHVREGTECVTMLRRAHVMCSTDQEVSIHK